MSQPLALNPEGPRIWAVSGGKGGTGKSFLAAQLAVTQASRGRSVILVDADPQGAGIHGLLGLDHQSPDITDFLDGDCPLNECLHRTPFHTLRMIYGNSSTRLLPHATPEKISTFHKELLMLDAEIVIIDLGGGMSPDTLRMFLSVHVPLVVAVPETPALENFFQFIRALRFFTLNQWLRREGAVQSVEEIWEKRPKEDVVDLADLRHYLPALLGFHRATASRWPAGPAIHLVLNHLTSIDEVQHGFSLRSLCRKHLDLPLKYSGYVENESKIWKKLSAVQGRPQMNITPRIRQEILRIGNNLMHDREMVIGSGKNA